MTPLMLHEFHAALGARFGEVNGCEMVAGYGDVLAEHGALSTTAGVVDLSFRSRLCLLGGDRIRLLNGQVTNNVKDLAIGQGCYAAFVSAKGRLQADANIYRLREELLLDLEPGLTTVLTQRLEHFIIADDVQVVDVASHYGLLSVQGPQSWAAIARLDLPFAEPSAPFAWTSVNDATLGETYSMKSARASSPGFDLFVPSAALAALADKLIAAARQLGGGPCGWNALELARIEAGLPRFGVDMDETNLAPEAGLDNRAISYSKGCYIGQEVIARIRTYGQVAKALRGLRLANVLPVLPHRGDKLFHADKEVGYITSAIASPRFHANLALGYVRRECNEPGTELTLKTAEGESPARIVELPFRDEA